LKSLRSFDCITHIHVSEQRRKSLNKIDNRSTRGCFIGYLDTSKMHKIWDFERKCFVNSHDLIFEETQFPKPSDFDEIPIDPYIPSSSPEHQSKTRQIFDEIIVLPPPTLQVFSIYENFQPENDPPSFSDAMHRPDKDLWWNAFYVEIQAIIANNTWILT